MAPDKKLSANIPDEFDIPAEGTQKPVKVKLKGKGKGKFDVWKKDIPADIPTSWTDPDDGRVKSITWLNNFGLKLKGKDAFEDDVDEYDLEFDEEPGKDIVYYSKKQVIKVRDVKGVGTGKLTISLAVGDPPVGSGER
jgi:hypothetical protein